MENPLPDGQPAPPRPSILIVDDVPANLGVLLDLLDEAGYEVLVAESGESALRLLGYACPDVILLDVSMPGIDGFATCERIKASAAWKEIPVLFLTALTDVVDKVRGFAAGAVDFITKPLQPEEVLARVRSHLQIRHLRQDLEEKNTLLESAIALRLEAERQLQQSLDRAVLIVDRAGQIQFCTRLAARLLARHFPGYAPGGPLPEPLARWVAGADRNLPWQAEHAGARLKVRLFAERGADAASFMLLLEETAAAPGGPASLLRLGLTAREAEVLYWIAHGKTSPEIAVILQAALNTIKKHVQNILLKLGVETRLAAALQASEILGLGQLDPARFRGDLAGTDAARLRV